MQPHDIVDLLQGAGVISGPSIQVTGIAYRSDAVRPGDAFFCVPGHRFDGHMFAADAVRRGAAALVVTRALPDFDNGLQVRVADARLALAYASAAFFGSPSRSLDVVGVTGTNGKTTTTYLIDSVLKASGRRTGLLGTVETRIAEESFEAGRTTPESADLQKLLATMRDAGVDAVSMEVSSHAIDLHRVAAVRFAVAGFTNLTQDHLDYHHTIEEYFSVKKRLFTDLDVAVGVINIDDPLGAGLAAELDSALTVGTSSDAAIRATDLRLGSEGSRFTLETPRGSVDVRLPLAGAFNVSNALVAAGCAYALDLPVRVIAEGLGAAPQVPGRLERVEEGQPFRVFVDYAHTPDSLEKAIEAVRRVTPGRVIVVFGCGGDRDPDKRPLMGAAAQAADHAIVTSDNPRSEDPVGIILQIEDGMLPVRSSWQVEVDRRKAIAAAFAQAVSGDAILIAGKGHEDYQIFADRTIHFDDREVAREELRALC
ncbi:MAG: UDP-N-acetylmuramoyl-L-alanyl-D-glutamate--2,6-diaminopimelate ligase [Coriobacteriia bacterium]|nr:UDP-N-acetylmuramoyl-L-alanyl-D-glutamate--2,6-diaminopimelate ligase [Coriobacteriia bacterium]